MKCILCISVILVISGLSLSVHSYPADLKKAEGLQFLLSAKRYSCDFYQGIDSLRPFTDTINFMGHWYSEDKREDFVREWIYDYQKEHPDVYVNLKFSHEIVGQKSKFNTAWFIYEMILYNNYNWDIVWIDDNIYQIVSDNIEDINWSEKHLVDFSMYPEFIQGHKDEIIRNSAYRNLTGGQLIGPMIEGYYGLLWYNEVLASKIGLSVKSHGMSYKDFLAYIKKIYEYNKKHNTSYAALYESYDWRTTGQFLFQQLFNSAVSEEKKRKSQKSEQEIKDVALLKSLQAFEELSKYAPLITNHDNNQWFSTRDYMLKDSCVFYLGGSWMHSHWNALDSTSRKKAKAAELPVFNSSDSYLGGYIPTWGVMKNSPNRERAVEFMLFICQQKYADKWKNYTQTPTGLKESRDSDHNKRNKHKDINEYLKGRYGKNINFTADTKYIFGDAKQVTQHTFYEKLIDVLTGKRTAQQAFDDLK